jgi:hypothetical protein
MPFVMLLILGALFYILFIKGWAWKLLLLTVVPYWCAVALATYVPALRNTMVVITPIAHQHFEISWALGLSFVVIGLCVAFSGRRGE